MPGFHEGLNIEADTAGQAIAALLNENGLLITGQEWSSPGETERVFGQMGRIIDGHLQTTSGVTLHFREAHRRTNPILALGDFDFSPLYDQHFGLLTNRIVILEADKLGLTADNGTYEIKIYDTDIYIGKLCIWRQGWR